MSLRPARTDRPRVNSRYPCAVASATVKVMAAVAAVACAHEPDAQAPRGPEVVAVDSMLLFEDDSTFLADVTLVDVDASGSVLVADNFHKRVTEYDRLGALQATYGAKGQGPGEFLMLGVPLFLGDSLIAVADNRRRVISIFSRGGSFVRQLASPGVAYDGVARGGALWLGALDSRGGTGVARVEWPRDSVKRLVPVPQLYRESQRWAGMNTTVSLDEWRDTLFVGFSGDNSVLITDRNGTVLRRIVIPRQYRLGVPEDILMQLESSPPGSGFDKYSALFSLHRLSDGSIGLVHFDQTISAGGTYETVFLSIISPDRSRACVDGHIPVYRQTQPAVRWRGDSLVLVEQAVVDSSRAVTIARTYEIRLGGCDWIPVE